ncbi:hypothetical protein BJ741DRAFT_611922 [Chytriomyces cf. hyalinus JEL632]|nr:hypothetical protein BJ741DRAFT_611922 [Chytriomyces cf. hyalinus JEL632]
MASRNRKWVHVQRDPLTNKASLLQETRKRERRPSPDGTQKSTPSSTLNSTLNASQVSPAQITSLLKHCAEAEHQAQQTADTLLKTCQERDALQLKLDNLAKTPNENHEKLVLLTHKLSVADTRIKSLEMLASSRGTGSMPVYSEESMRDCTHEDQDPNTLVALDQNQTHQSHQMPGSVLDSLLKQSQLHSIHQSFPSPASSSRSSTFSATSSNSGGEGKPNRERQSLPKQSPATASRDPSSRPASAKPFESSIYANKWSRDYTPQKRAPSPVKTQSLLSDPQRRVHEPRPFAPASIYSAASRQNTPISSNFAAFEAAQRQSSSIMSVEHKRPLTFDATIQTDDVAPNSISIRNLKSNRGSMDIVDSSHATSIGHSISEDSDPIPSSFSREEQSTNPKPLKSALKKKQKHQEQQQVSQFEDQQAEGGSYVQHQPNHFPTAHRLHHSNNLNARSTQPSSQSNQSSFDGNSNSRHANSKPRKANNSHAGPTSSPTNIFAGIDAFSATSSIEALVPSDSSILFSNDTSMAMSLRDVVAQADALLLVEQKKRNKKSQPPKTPDAVWNHERDEVLNVREQVQESGAESHAQLMNRQAMIEQLQQLEFGGLRELQKNVSAGVEGVSQEVEDVIFQMNKWIAAE